jgi:hypothetical protein
VSVGPEIDILAKRKQTMSMLGAFFQRRKVERMLRNRAPVLDAIGVFRAQWFGDLKSRNLDPRDFGSVRFARRIAGPLDKLTRRVSDYVGKHPDDAPMRFIAVFFASYFHFAFDVGRELTDPIELLNRQRKLAKLTLTSLHLIAMHRDTTEEAYKLLSGATAVPEALRLRFDLERPTPAQRAETAMAVYETFWRAFVCRDVVSPLAAGGEESSLRSFLESSGLSGE